MRDLTNKDWRLEIGKLAAGGLLLDELTVGSEAHFHFDLLETAVVADQSLADEIDRFVTFVVKAEVIVQVDAAFDDLTAAVALHVEDVIALIRLGIQAAKEIFEEAHVLPF